MGCSGSKKDTTQETYSSANSDDADVAVAALQKAFLDGQISAVVYEQACAGLANNNNNNNK